MLSWIVRWFPSKNTGVRALEPPSISAARKTGVANSDVPDFATDCNTNSVGVESWY